MKKGFTLVEMLVVMGILAVLIGIGISSFTSTTKRAQKARAQELVLNTAAALEAINARCVFDKRLQGSKIVAKVTEDETHAENPHVTTLWLRIRRGLTVIVK